MSSLCQPNHISLMRTNDLQLVQAKGGRDVIERAIQRNSGPKGASALSQLSTTIGYRIKDFDLRMRRLVIADALVRLEMLKKGRRITRRPREMKEPDVMDLVQKLIPTEQFVTLGIKTEVIVRDDWRSSIADLMQAACNYIQSLEQRHSKPDEQRPKQPNEEALIGRALEKMEKWCDAWLEGKLKEGDWDKFEKCVE